MADGEQLPFARRILRSRLRPWRGAVHRRPQATRGECHRVLKPRGEAIFQVYNRVSWLNALSKVMKVGLEHEDAPVLRKYTIGEFRRLMTGFARCGSCPNGFR